MTDTIKAKRGKQWFIWKRGVCFRWICYPCAWTGESVSDRLGMGDTKDAAYADLVGGA